MSKIASLFNAVSPAALNRVTAPHDEFRSRFVLVRNTVESPAEFEAIIGDYYQRHSRACGLSDAALLPFEAKQAAKEIVTRKSHSFAAECDNAMTGRNGGLFQSCNAICDELKKRSEDRYIDYVIDAHVAANSFDERVEFVREFIAAIGSLWPEELQKERPEEYAQNIKPLVVLFIEAKKGVGARARRV